MTLEEFKNKYDEGIRLANEQQTDVMDRLDKIKGAVRTTLRDEVERLVPDVTTLLEYVNMGCSTQDEFFAEVSPELLCDVIGRYSVNERKRHGLTGFDKDLSDAYDLKSSKKTSQKARAEEVIKAYKKVLEDNKVEIEKLKAELERKQKEYDDLKAGELSLLKPNAAGEKPESIALREKFINELPARFEKLENEIKDLKIQIEQFENVQMEYEHKIEKAIREFEDTFKEKSQVDVGAYRQENVNSNNTEQTTTTSFSTNRINPLLNTNDSDRQIARKMLLDIRNMDQDDMVNLINQYGYEDLLTMARNLGPFGRTELRNILDSAMNSTNFAGLNTNIRNTIVAIQHGTISDADLMRESTRIQQFLDEIDTKSYEEIQAFYDEISAFNIAALWDVANRKGITKFFDRFSKAGNARRVLNEKLKKVSNIRYERETLARKTSNDLRSRIGAQVVQDQRSRMFVNRRKESPARDNRELR